MECMICRSKKDVEAIELPKYGKIAVCIDCRTKPSTGVGRPSLGVTKKVSLTLSKEDWDWFDEQSEGNRSQYLRQLIQQEKERN